MNEHHQFIVLLLSVIVFVYCTITLLTDTTPTSDAGVKLRSLDETEVIRYLQRKQFAPVDVIVLPPFIMDTDGNGQPGGNLSIVSVMRFMPWFRRMHIYDPQNEECKNQVEYWKTHQKAKFVFFSQDLVSYSLTTPFLEERFVVLRPKCILSNYTFMWQFFIDDSPVIRSCRSGMLPLTRTLLNECIYSDVGKGSFQEKIAFAVETGIRHGQIKYIDNHDRFVPACSSSEITSTKHVGDLNPLEVRQLLQFEEPKKDRSKPFKIVMCVISEAKDDLIYTLPAEHESTIQVWVLLNEHVHPRDRLAFAHRMIVKKNIVVEVIAKDFEHSSEKIGAEVMKQISAISGNERFQVVSVFSYLEPVLANQVGNKLGRAYNAPFTKFSKDETVKDQREWMRHRYV